MNKKKIIHNKVWLLFEKGHYLENNDLTETSCSAEDFSWNKETKTFLRFFLLNSLQIIACAHILTRLMFLGFLLGQEHHSIFRKVLLTQ